MRKPEENRELQLLQTPFALYKPELEANLQNLLSIPGLTDWKIRPTCFSFSCVEDYVHISDVLFPDAGG